MGYSSSEYQARPQVMLAGAATATGTLTASGVNTLTTNFPFPTFARRSKITSIKAVIKTAPAANVTVTTLNVLNGTSTAGVITISTNTAGVVVAGTVTASNGTFALGSAPSVTVVATGTASAQSYGAYEIFAEVQELYS